jgi:N-acetylmuramoyl-L-alanine amidase
MIGGKYVTAPHKMHTFPDGFVLCEGVFNRAVSRRLEYLLKAAGIPHTLLVPSDDDVSLRTRVRSANTLHLKHDRNTVLISIHGNAGGGTGFEVWTTRGQTKSDTIAPFFLTELANEFPDKKKRVDFSDGDVDKESNFTILKCYQPAVLTENLFFDNRSDAEIMGSIEGVNRIAWAHFIAIQKVDDMFSHIDEIK